MSPFGIYLAFTFGVFAYAGMPLWAVMVLATITAGELVNLESNLEDLERRRR